MGSAAHDEEGAGVVCGVAVGRSSWINSNGSLLVEKSYIVSSKKHLTYSAHKKHLTYSSILHIQADKNPSKRKTLLVSNEC